MKSMKKLIVAVMAVVAAMALCVPALAFADNDASIEIDASNDDAASITTTYNYYEIFVADIGSLGAINPATGDLVDPADLGQVAYYIPSPSGDALKAAIETNAPGFFTFTKSGDGSRWVVELADTSKTGADIANALSVNAITSKALAHNEFTMSSGVAKAENLQPGYYIVTSTLGTKVAVQTLGNVKINEKNDYIVDDKVVETASVTIGESATYYIKVFLPATIDTTKKVTVHDEMADVLSFDNNLKVYVSDTDPGTTAAQYAALTYGDLTSEYSVKISDLGDNCDFHVDITTTNLAGKYVVFKFSATLLATADPDGDGYVNKEWSTYPGYETVPSNPKVWTYQFDVLKTDENGKKLDGAEFQLHKGAADGAVLKFAEVQTGVYKKTADDTGTETLVVNSDTLQKATKVQGLGAGTYYLVETKAANGGYNLLAQPIVITITEKDPDPVTGVVAGAVIAKLNGNNIGNGDSGNIVITVINEAGTQLPSTGGMGTTILYVVGGIMIALAAAFLIRRRIISKKNESEDLM